MERSNLILTVVVLTFVSSGCMSGGGSSDGLDIGKGGNAMTVTQFDIQPTDIMAGSGTTITMGITNTGYLNSEVDVGDEGRELLTNYCSDIFNIQSFDAYSSSSQDIPADNEFSLEPGEEIRATWQLENENADAVPLMGFRCPMRVQVPFNYSVQAYQQIQVKENTEVQGTPQLASRTSSGPLNLVVETIGSTSEEGAPTFIEGNNMEVLVQMRNQQPEESTYRGIVELGSPVISTSESFVIDRESCNLRSESAGGITGDATEGSVFEPPSDSDSSSEEEQSSDSSSDDAPFEPPEDEDSDSSSGAGDTPFQTPEQDYGEGEASGDGLVNAVQITEDMRLYQGQSRVVRCSIELAEDLDQPSTSGELRAHANYSYVKDMGQTQVEVEYRGS